MAGTSGGASGKYGSALLAANLGRAGALSNADTTAASNAAQLQFSGANLATNLLGQNFGSTTSGTSSQTNTGATTGSSSGWNIGGGVGASGSVAGGLNSLSFGA